MLQKIIMSVLMFWSVVSAGFRFDSPLFSDAWGHCGNGVVIPTTPKEGGSFVLSMEDSTVFFGYGVIPGDSNWNLESICGNRECGVRLHTEAFYNPDSNFPEAYAGLWVVPTGTSFDDAKPLSIGSGEQLRILFNVSGSVQIRLKVAGDGPLDGPPTLTIGAVGSQGMSLIGDRVYNWTSFKRPNWGGRLTFDSTDLKGVTAIGFVKMVGGVGPIFPAKAQKDIALRIYSIESGVCEDVKEGYRRNGLS